MLKELKTQHRTLIQMSFNGFSNNEIAEKLGMTPGRVSIILRSPLGQAYLGGLNDRAKEATLDVRKKLVSLNSKALAAFDRILDPKTPKVPYNVQYTTAKDVLDRNGYKAPDRISVDMSLSVKTDAELDAEIAAVEESIKRTQGIDISQETKTISSVAASISLNNHHQKASVTSDEFFEDEDLSTLEDPLLELDPEFNPFQSIEAN